MPFKIGQRLKQKVGENKRSNECSNGDRIHGVSRNGSQRFGMRERSAKLYRICHSHTSPKIPVLLPNFSFGIPICCNMRPKRFESGTLSFQWYARCPPCLKPPPA